VKDLHVKFKSDTKYDPQFTINELMLVPLKWVLIPKIFTWTQVYPFYSLSTLYFSMIFIEWKYLCWTFPTTSLFLLFYQTYLPSEAIMNLALQPHGIKCKEWDKNTMIKDWKRKTWTRNDPLWGHNAFAGYPEMSMVKKAALILCQLWHKKSTIQTSSHDISQTIAVDYIITKFQTSNSSNYSGKKRESNVFCTSFKPNLSC